MRSPKLAVSPHCRSFAPQTRDSAITGVGYQIAVDAGLWRPFAKVAWNHEWINDGWQVTAFLTTVAAPGFSMPAVVLGRDWGAASAGTTLQIAERVTALIALTSQFAQRQAAFYGAQVGVNAAF